MSITSLSLIIAILQARANSSKRYAASPSCPCFFRPSVEKN